MNSVQESKNELNAAIRYAENAISSAKQTIESMEFRQEMAKKQYSEQTGREAVLESELAGVRQLLDKMTLEHTDREEALQREVAELRDIIDRMGDDSAGDSVTIKHLREVNQELESKVQRHYEDIVQLERDLTVKTANANAWKKEYDKLKEVNREAELEAENAKLRKDKERLTGLEIQLRDKIWELKEGVPTMPVIPKAVAIAIFREGVQHGVEAACTELEGQHIRIEESEYVGDFYVTFERRIDLDDELDLDWMREKCGDYSEESAIDALGTLCADEKFECRIHGIDDQEENKND